jgi:hypothetical protein
MIEAHQFVEAARDQGFNFYAGVPCSFLTPFINYVIEDEQLTYLSSANEGQGLPAHCFARPSRIPIGRGCGAFKRLNCGQVGHVGL